uniref:J domain-containing protein n=1 Tax=Timema douglasi TaxID=61478 RepID=A0A7R8Z8J9_TIMDO|nr:unnamed protein product [Timema douglasi]
MTPSQATADEINNAYRRMSRLYHPDKHLEPLRKKEAEILFNKTKKAYEVLSDPHQRAIYDSLGTRGLETEGWEIVQRTKTPQEIREEYERLAREQGGFPTIEVSGMSFSQSIEAPLTLQDTVTMTGSLSAQNGVGSGSVNVSARRLVSEKGWVEAEFGAGSGPMLSLKGFRTLTKRTFANATGLFQFTPVGIRPGLVTSEAGTFGAILEYGAEKKVSQHTSIAASVVVGVPTGVTLKINPVFYATVTPVIVWAVLKRLVIDPMVREQKERDIEKQREVNKSRITEKRREAKAAVNLMRATFARIRSDEEAKKGLVIVKALYGRLSAADGGGEGDGEEETEVIDVMIPLQCLVKDSKLVLHEASKSQLPGFYDPCMGEDKSLFVQYLYHSHVHEVTVQDKEALRIPKQSNMRRETPACTKWCRLRADPASDHKIPSLVFCSVKW